MTNIEFANKAREIAKSNTSYILGGFGHFANEQNIQRELNRTDVNNRPYQQGAYSIKDNGWLWDCCGLCKGILWSFDFKPYLYGGAEYKSNGVPDVGADTLLNMCNEISTDFTKIDIGEVVWIKGHIGIYVGDNLVVEATPKWSVAPGVKISILGNRQSTGGRVRKWTKHGKLPWVEFVKESDEVVYHTLNEVPDWAYDAIKHYIDNGSLAGTSENDLNLSYEMTRTLTILYRDRIKET